MKWKWEEAYERCTETGKHQKKKVICNYRLIIIVMVDVPEIMAVNIPSFSFVKSNEFT